MDTEGLDAVDRTSRFDDKVFTLAALLASKLVYNSTGSIDEKSLQRLSFVTALAKVLGKSESSSDIFPELTWVLRDFTLRLEGSDRRRISADTYLENQLAKQPGFDSKIMQRNRICAALRRFFPNRRCVTLVRPADDEKTLQNLSAALPEQLRPPAPRHERHVRSFGKTHARLAIRGARRVLSHRRRRSRLQRLEQ